MDAKTKKQLKNMRNICDIIGLTLTPELSDYLVGKNGEFRKWSISVCEYGGRDQYGRARDKWDYDLEHGGGLWDKKKLKKQNLFGREIKDVEYEHDGNGDSFATIYVEATPKELTKQDKESMINIFQDQLREMIEDSLETMINNVVAENPSLELEEVVHYVNNNVTKNDISKWAESVSKFAFPKFRKGRK